MTVDLEARLRSDLPRLADLLTDTDADVGVGGEAGSYVAGAALGGRSRRPLWLAVAACLLAVVGVLAVVARTGDDRATTSVTAEPVAQPDTWQALPPMPLSPREDSTSVWTGSEWLVFGGREGLMAMNDSAAYDPGTGTWRLLAANPTMHPGAQAVWTGQVAVVLAKGGGWTYDPAADTWTDLPRQTDQPDGVIVNGAGVWTGDEVVTVGVVDVDGHVALGARSLDPTAMSWGAATRTAELTPPSGHELTVAGARWDGSRVQVWLTDGEGWAYDPAGGNWTELPALPLPSPSGSTMLSVTGSGGRTYVLAITTMAGSSAQLDLFENGAWRLVGEPQTWPTTYFAPTLVMAGDELIVFSLERNAKSLDTATGAIRSFASPLVEAGLGRTIVWTGRELLVAGGRDTDDHGNGQLTAAAARLYAAGN